MSNAGKSLIAAGLCRIFAQDGYKTAPLNPRTWLLTPLLQKTAWKWAGHRWSRRGGRSKAFCGYDPILLKPTTDVGSQVIVNGVSIGNMRAKDYFAYKKR